jgi:hypothetical protein
MSVDNQLYLVAKDPAWRPDAKAVRDLIDFLTRRLKLTDRWARGASTEAKCSAKEIVSHLSTGMPYVSAECALPDAAQHALFGFDRKNPEAHHYADHIQVVLSDVPFPYTHWGEVDITCRRCRLDLKEPVYETYSLRGDEDAYEDVKERVGKAIECRCGSCVDVARLRFSRPVTFSRFALGFLPNGRWLAEVRDDIEAFEDRGFLRELTKLLGQKWAAHLMCSW